MVKLKYPIVFSPSSIIGLATTTKVIKETQKALDPTNIDRITRPKYKDRKKVKKYNKQPRKRTSMPRTKRKMKNRGTPRKYYGIRL
jgi:hypothetical protein